MLPLDCTTVWRWLTERKQGLCAFLERTPPSPAEAPWSLTRRPPLNELAALPRNQLPNFVQASTIACHYLDWLGALDWAHFPERSRSHDNGLHWRGPTPEQAAPYVAALLVKVDRHLPHMEDLRQCLVEHPALPWLFGFPLQASSRWAWGFDVDASLPSHRHFNRLLRTLPNDALQFLLSSSIQLLAPLLPAATLLGDEISLDTKHIIAWVKENNPKVFIKGGRFHKDRQPKGDPDCKVGFKAQANQTTTLAPKTPTTTGVAASQTRVGEYYWGYASGLVATKVPQWGEVVLAEKTLPFDHGELSYFLPLMRQVEARLGRRPRLGALDAAFDAFYVYAYFHHAKGFAAVPLRQSEQVRSFSAAGLPLCQAGLAMPLKSTYTDRTHLLHHRRGRYGCPLCFPVPTDQPCPIAHPSRRNGGCLTTLPTSIGTRIRCQLDRKAAPFQQLYRQRTATERIFSQAFELGIERPKLRNGASIANLNTLIYLTINLRTRQRIRRQQLPTAG
jgi:hypothetical protein